MYLYVIVGLGLAWVLSQPHAAAGDVKTPPAVIPPTTGQSTTTPTAIVRTVVEAAVDILKLIETKSTGA